MDDTLVWLLSLLRDAAVVGALLAFVMWLLRKWISARLTEDIRLNTEKKLHEFKTRLDSAEAQVTAVQRAGIDATQQMNAATLSERVQAIKEIWLGVVEWKAASALSTMISAMDIGMAVGSVGHAGTQRTMKTMLDSLQYMDLMKRANALARWRPFVTARGWALFAAYHGFYAARVTKAVLLMIGNAEMVRRVWQVDSELQLVRAAAPVEMVSAYEADPIVVGPKFLNYVEEELLAELQRSLAGEHSGPEALRQTAKIVAAVSNVMQEVQKAQNSASGQAS